MGNQLLSGATPTGGRSMGFQSPNTLRNRSILAFGYALLFIRRVYTPGVISGLRSLSPKLKLSQPARLAGGTACPTIAYTPSLDRLSSSPSVWLVCRSEEGR